VDDLADVYTDRPVGKILEALRQVQKYLEPTFCRRVGKPVSGGADERRAEQRPVIRQIAVSPRQGRENARKRLFASRIKKATCDQLQVALGGGGGTVKLSS
jgi:hypothetical protein